MSIEQRAEQVLLEALLGRRPLPGSDQALLVPDLPDLGQERPAALVRSGALTPDAWVSGRVAAVDDAAAAAQLEPGTAVLEFVRPEQFPDRTSARVRVSVVDGTHRAVPLGEAVATFIEQPDGTLVTAEPTHVLAY